MYQFAHLLHRSETHNVVFQTADRSACVGFCKTLLLGVSEVWRSRDENWRYVRDSKGRITHTVDIQADSAQDVLNALQAAIFTGKLPECSLQVLLRLARLADAELMPSVVDLVADAVDKLTESAEVGVHETELPDRIHSLEAAVGHISRLQAWVCCASESLAAPIAGQADIITRLLTDLPANCYAALGVLKAAWPRMVRGFLPGEFDPYHAAIMRHSQVLINNADRCFLTSARAICDNSTIMMMCKMAHHCLGSPAEALSSDAALEAFVEKVFHPQPILHIWDLYFTGPDPNYLKLFLRTQLVASRHSLWQHVCLCPPDSNTMQRLCGDLLHYSATELRELLLPVLRASYEDESLISAVEALATVQEKLAEERHLRQQQQQPTETAAAAAAAAEAEVIADEGDDQVAEQQQQQQQQRRRQGRLDRVEEVDEDDEADRRWPAAAAAAAAAAAEDVVYASDVGEQDYQRQQQQHGHRAEVADRARHHRDRQHLNRVYGQDRQRQYGRQQQQYRGGGWGNGRGGRQHGGWQQQQQQRRLPQGPEEYGRYRPY